MWSVGLSASWMFPSQNIKPSVILQKEFHENLEIKCDSLDISPPSWHHGLRRVSESYKHFNLTLQQLSWLAIAMIYNSGRLSYLYVHENISLFVIYGPHLV